MKDCTNCENCVYICEGDFICDKGAEPVIVMEDFCPNENFCYCQRTKQKQKFYFVNKISTLMKILINHSRDFTAVFVDSKSLLKKITNILKEQHVEFNQTDELTEEIIDAFNEKTYGDILLTLAGPTPPKNLRADCYVIITYDTHKTQSNYQKLISKLK